MAGDPSDSNILFAVPDNLFPNQVYRIELGLEGESHIGNVRVEITVKGQRDTLDPEGLTGDQKVDMLTPPGVQGVTFSRTAYIALNAKFDVFAPGPEMIVRGIFKTRKVRFFDSNGVQTGAGYSDNPAWQIADLLTVVRGLSDSR